MSTSNPASLSAESIRRALREFQLIASDEQVQQIQQHISILLRWNEKLNLTAIRDPLEILYRHFCESMYAAAALPLEAGRLADVGAGAGFPGLPLKIIRPSLQVVLVESNLKKSTFLAEVIRELGLKDTQVLVRRYEELGEELAPAGYICARALGNFPVFLQWAHTERLGCKQVILWIGERDLPGIKGIPGWEWREPIRVPQSLRRLLLVGARTI
jgi:16S rRNA (guanine527-N7)-methyltransferase